MRDSGTEGSKAGDCATVSVRVAVPIEVAFDVFTLEIDKWWKQGPRYRIAGKRRGLLYFEPRLGGRLYESFDLSTGPKTIDVGRVTVWEPPVRLELEWRGVNFKPHEKTTVEVRFEAKGEGTLVTVRHSGWSAIPEDHPARHGLVGAAFIRMIAMWWSDLMTSLREQATPRAPEA